ncbi:MAG: hypothetical protein FGM62_06110 [Methylobacterium sp.]|nr:hypothetical protein [Methylobacterium sp.]
MYKSLLLTLATCCLLAACNPGPARPDPEIRAVNDFYQTVLSLRRGGIPSKSEIARLSPLISESFRARLLAALEAEARAFSRTQGKEPPLVQGALFYSLFEGADRLLSVKPDPDAAAHAYLVELEYGPPSDPRQHTRWHDRATLKQEGNRWVVDDIELLGDWSFGAKGKLSDILQQVATFDAATGKP